MEQSGPYEAVEYQAPQILKAISWVLEVPRLSTKFSDLFSIEDERQMRYEKGLILLASAITTFLILWGLILLYLKCKGRSVGCASGRAFEIAYENDQDHRSSHGSTFKEYLNDEASFSSSIYSSEVNSTYDSADIISNDDDYSIDDAPARESIRAQRTRIIFLLFAFIVLVCVPLLLTFSFAPIKEAGKQSETIIAAGRDVLSQVEAATSTVSSATENAREILLRTPVEFNIFCPNVNPNLTEEILGVDLVPLVDIVASEYAEIEQFILMNVSKVEGLLQDIQGGLDEVEYYFGRLDEVLWFVPALLLAVSLLTGYIAFGVLLARKRNSSRNFQRALSYAVLPLFIIACLGCWALVLSSSITTALGADLCLSSTGHGTPDTEVQDILAELRMDPNSTSYNFISAYTSGCGEDPTSSLLALEELAQKNVDAIWRHISTVDSVGRTDLIRKCGGSLNDLLSGARNLAKLLTKIRRALDSVSDSLSCNRIGPLYEDGMYETVCTDVTTATSWGFIFSLVVGISMMIMISLRASWVFQFEEEKVYHDEREVAENMIVDEHEEYLNYISKYRHEWQEYGGFDTTSIRHSNSNSDDGSATSYFSGSHSRGFEDSQSADFSEEDLDPEPQPQPKLDQNDFTEPPHQYNDAIYRYTDSVHRYTVSDYNEDIIQENPSVGSADISFPSLDVPPSDESTEARVPLSALSPMLVSNVENELDNNDTQSNQQTSNDIVEDHNRGIHLAKQRMEGAAPPAVSPQKCDNFEGGTPQPEREDDEESGSTSARMLARAKRCVTADSFIIREEDFEKDPYGLVGKSVLASRLVYHDQQNEDEIEVAISPVSINSEDFTSQSRDNADSHETRKVDVNIDRSKTDDPLDTGSTAIRQNSSSGRQDPPGHEFGKQDGIIIDSFGREVALRAPRPLSRKCIALSRSASLPKASSALPTSDDVVRARSTGAEGTVRFADTGSKDPPSVVKKHVDQFTKPSAMKKIPRTPGRKGGDKLNDLVQHFDAPQNDPVNLRRVNSEKKKSEPNEDLAASKLPRNQSIS